VSQAAEVQARPAETTTGKNERESTSAGAEIVRVKVPTVHSPEETAVEILLVVDDNLALESIVLGRRLI
jgi:hypothetical protein